MQCMNSPTDLPHLKGFRHPRHYPPYFLDNPASVISSRLASTATLALNSGEWFFRFLILDHFFHHAFHLNNWFESSRPRLKLWNKKVILGTQASQVALQSCEEQFPILLHAGRGFVNSNAVMFCAISVSLVLIISHTKPCRFTWLSLVSLVTSSPAPLSNNQCATV